MRQAIHPLFTGMVLLLLGAVALSFFYFPWQAALVPGTLGCAGVLLAAAQLRKDVVNIRRHTAQGAESVADVVDLPAVEGAGTRTVMLRTAVTALWFVGYILAVLLIGFLIASPLFVFCYIVFRARSSALVGALSAIGVVALQWGIFFELLSRPWLTPFWAAPQEWLVQLL